LNQYLAFWKKICVFSEFWDATFRFLSDGITGNAGPIFAEWHFRPIAFVHGIRTGDSRKIPSSCIGC